MITDKKITAYKGIAAHFDAGDGKSIILVAEDAESLKLASEKFREGQNLNRDRCQNVIVISAKSLESS